jgi:hypothetical protein
MATQKIIWTVLPKGFTRAGELVVSIVPSFRLTPQAANEQQLRAFPDLLDWPALLAASGFDLRVGAQAFQLKPISRPDARLWHRVFPKDLPVAGYVFNDLSKHNLRSFPVRTLVSFLHTHYGAFAESDGLERPSLFGPGSRLQGMLGELGIGRQGRVKGDINRWFADGRSKEGGLTNLEQGLKDDYFSSQGFAPPTVIGIDGRPRKNASSFISQRKLRRALPATLSGAAASYFSGEPEYALYQANRFYQRPENARPYARLPVAGSASPPVSAPEFDFHRLAGSFADAPALMRRLGLVLDAIVVNGGVLVKQAQGLPQDLLKGKMRLAVKHDRNFEVATEESTPATAFWLTPERFTCDARTPRHRAGLLRLGGARAIGNQAQQAKIKDAGFSLTAVDPDGAALKTVGFALALQDHLFKVSNPLDPNTLDKPGELTYTTSQGEAVAALRSGGLTLVEHGRAEHIADETIASSLKNEAANGVQANNIVLYTEDVLRGYRVDVFTNKSGVWNSLCRRIAEYGWVDGDGPELEPASDEGYLSGASTTTKPADELPPDATQDHYLHEALVKWTGWSLIAQRPGRRIRPYPDNSTPPEERKKLGLIQEEKVDAQSAADTHAGGTPITRRVSAAPGSLPRLRFGLAYRMRARLVDLAGNSLELDDPALGGLEEASELVPYLRYEPLDSPVLSLRGRVSEGESLERMVIRSNFKQTSAEYLQEAPYAGNAPTETGFAYAEASERHVVPPKTSQLMAEQHGAFERAFGPGAPPEEIAQAYQTISEREAGTLYDGGASVHIVTPPKEGALPPSPEHDLAEKPPEGFRLLPGEYVIHTEVSLATPYLPDPLAAAVALRGVPGVFTDAVIDATDGVRSVRIPNTEEHVLIVPLSGEWPKLQGFRLVIVEHPDEAGFDGCMPGAQLPVLLPKWEGGDARVLTVFLRKGEIAQLRCSSALRPAFLNHLAIPQLAATPLKVAIQSVLGAHWMVTPDRPLTLVHATQQPVCAPLFEGLTLFRSRGQTWVELSRKTQVRYHARSTAKLEVLAEWMEWLDDPAQPAPIRRRVTAQLPEVAIPSPPLRGQEPFSNIFYDQLGTGGTEAAHAHARHEFGDHKFRLVHYRLRGTTRFREYLPPSITADPAKLVRIGPVFEGHTLKLPVAYESLYPDPDTTPPQPQVPPTDAELGAPLLPQAQPLLPGSIVPCSDRPAAPKIAYLVPTFRWSHTHSQTGTVSIRRGNGLRVYLERPWFSSGEGELLGVVVSSAIPAEQPFANLPDPLIGYVSQWGQDPIVASELPRSAMHPSAFGARVASYSFHLPEANRTMEIAAHRVHYDFHRRLWYADIEIDAGPSYVPFVRLALVRVQPYAVSDCALSAVVHTQYAQLLPTRELHLDRAGNIYALHVYGQAPEHGSASARGELGGRFGAEAAIADAFGSLLGYDQGRNRIEMVVQQQSSGLDTDLDWVDVAGIGPLSGDAEPGQTAPLAVRHQGVGEDPIRHDDRGQARTDGAVFSQRIRAEIFDAGLQNLHLLRTDLLFTGRLTVPPTPEGSRRRLMVREYERHFGDFTITDSTPIGRVQRPGVTERLVFAREFYVLGYEPPIRDNGNPEDPLQ